MEQQQAQQQQPPHHAHRSSPPVHHHHHHHHPAVSSMAQHHPAAASVHHLHQASSQHQQQQPSSHPPEPRSRSASPPSQTEAPPAPPRPIGVTPEGELIIKEIEALLEATCAQQQQQEGASPAKLAVHRSSVLCGRGGETNHHPGNVQYRQLVKACQPAYIQAKRRHKPRIAILIVHAVRQAGGQFLKKCPQTGAWQDVGSVKAREKTSQALREGAPELRHEAVYKAAAAAESPERPTASSHTKKRKLVASHVAAPSVPQYQAPVPSVVPVHHHQHHAYAPPPPSSAPPMVVTRPVYPPTVVYPPQEVSQGVHDMEASSSRHASTSMTSPPRVDRDRVLVVNESSSSSSSSSSSKTRGGPRIKLLKRRLLEEASH